MTKENKFASSCLNCEVKDHLYCHIFEIVKNAGHIMIINNVFSFLAKNCSLFKLKNREEEHQDD